MGRAASPVFPQGLGEKPRHATQFQIHIAPSVVGIERQPKLRCGYGVPQGIVIGIGGQSSLGPGIAKGVRSRRNGLLASACVPFE